MKISWANQNKHVRAYDSTQAQQFSSLWHRTCWWHSLDDVLRPSGTQRLDSLDRLIRYEVATTATVQNGEGGEGVKEEGTTTGWLPCSDTCAVAAVLASCHMR